MKINKKVMMIQRQYIEDYPDEYALCSILAYIACLFHLDARCINLVLIERKFQREIQTFF
jgi:hypothetical protein